MNILRKIKDQRGLAMAEFAVVAPVLLVLLFGIIEFGLLMYNKAVLTNACREGARQGIVFDNPRMTDETITQVVNSYCADYLISFSADSAITVNVSRTGNSSGESLTVRVVYPYHFLALSGLFKLIGGSVDGTLSLSSESIMRLE